MTRAGGPSIVVLAGGVGGSRFVLGVRAALRARGEGKDADMVAAMDHLVPGQGVDFAQVGRILLLVLAVYVGAALLSFLPPMLDGFTAAPARELATAPAAVDLPGWRGTSLVPCARTAEGLRPAEATRPNMLRGLATSDVLAVVPPDGAAAGAAVRILPLPW